MTSEVNDLTFSVMVTGDFIAMFTLFGVLMVAAHFVITKAKPHWCYDLKTVPSGTNQNSSFKSLRNLSARMKSFLKREHKKESLKKTVSFDGLQDDDEDKPQNEFDEEAIYEEPYEVQEQVQKMENAPKEREIFV